MKKILIVVSIVLSIVIGYIGYTFISIQLNTVTAKQLSEKIKDTEIPLFSPIEEVNEKLSKKYINLHEEKAIIDLLVNNDKQLYDLSDNEKVITLLITSGLIGDVYIKKSTPISQFVTIFHESKEDAVNYEANFLETSSLIDNIKEVTLLDEQIKIYQKYDEGVGILTKDNVSHIYSHFDPAYFDFSKIDETLTLKETKDLTHNH